jgi:hypothetical protein
VVLKVDSTEVFDEGKPGDHAYDEYRMQVVDDMFNLEGIWFRLLKDSSGGFYGIEYAYVENSRLRQEIVSLDGTAQFKRWGLTFHFVYDGNGGTAVVVVKRVSIVVEDHIKEEWCIYSGSTEHPISHNIDATQRTFEWYLSNEIVNMRDAYPTQIDCLGNGVLYEGFLNNATFRLCAKNLNQGGSVATELVLKVIGREGNVEKELNIGPLYDNVLDVIPEKLIYGNMKPDWVFEQELGGTQLAVKRDVKGQNNRLNLIWLDTISWNSNTFVQEVGTLDDSNTDGDESETSKTVVTFGS